MGDRGFSLISVVVAIGLVGVLTVVISQMWRNNQTMMQRAKIDQEKMEIASLFSKKFSCQAKNCGTLKKKVRKIRLGRWHFRAKCNEDDLYVFTRKYLTDHKKPVTDPVSRRPMRWKPLFTSADGLFCTAGTAGGDPRSIRAIEENLKAMTGHMQESLREQEREDQALSGQQAMENRFEPSINPHDPNDGAPDIDREDLHEIEEELNQQLNTLCPEGQSVKSLNPNDFSITCE